MWKRRLCFAALLFACSALLAGCMSAEEKQKASTYEKEAKPYLIEYLNEHYPNAKAGNVENLTYLTDSLFPSGSVSSMVQLAYKDGGDTHHIIYDTETGDYYEDTLSNEFTSELWEQFRSSCDLSEAKDWSVSFTMPDVSYDFLTDFYSAGLTSLDELHSEGYEFTVTVDFEDVGTDLSSLDLFGEGWNLTAILTDYAAGRYGVNSSRTNCYSLAQYRREIFRQDEDEYYEIEPLYHRYKHVCVGDMEIVWAENWIDITVSTGDAPEEITPGEYNGIAFAAVDDTEVRLTVSGFLEDVPYASVYLFFPTELKKTYFLVGTESTGDYDVSVLGWEEDDHLYRKFTVYARNLPEDGDVYTLGYYEELADD